MTYGLYNSLHQIQNVYFDLISLFSFNYNKTEQILWMSTWIVNFTRRKCCFVNLNFEALIYTLFSNNYRTIGQLLLQEGNILLGRFIENEMPKLNTEISTLIIWYWPYWSFDTIVIPVPQPDLPLTLSQWWLAITL